MNEQEQLRLRCTLAPALSVKHLGPVASSLLQNRDYTNKPLGTETYEIGSPLSLATLLPHHRNLRIRSEFLVITIGLFDILVVTLE